MTIDRNGSTLARAGRRSPRTRRTRVADRGCARRPAGPAAGRRSAGSPARGCGRARSDGRRSPLAGEEDVLERWPCARCSRPQRRRPSVRERRRARRRTRRRRRRGPPRRRRRRPRRRPCLVRRRTAEPRLPRRRPVDATHELVVARRRRPEVVEPPGCDHACRRRGSPRRRTPARPRRAGATTARRRCPRSWPMRRMRCEHLLALHRVEAVGRLVEQHEVGVVGDGLGQLHPLALAGRHRADRAEPLLAEADLPQRVAGPVRWPPGAGGRAPRPGGARRRGPVTSGGRASCSGA